MLKLDKIEIRNNALFKALDDPKLDVVSKLIALHHWYYNAPNHTLCRDIAERFGRRTNCKND